MICVSDAKEFEEMAYYLESVALAFDHNFENMCMLLKFVVTKQTFELDRCFAEKVGV